MTPLPYRLDRTVTIRANRETVFRFFTDTARWATWWGAGSSVEARPGGRVYIRHPNGIESLGEVLEIRSPDRIVFTYGFVSGTPIPPGSSRVTIRLEALGSATRLHLAHEFAEESTRDEHVQGWRYQLSVFGNVVSDEVHGNGVNLVDGWFEAWSESDAARRREAFTRIAAEDVRFSDRFSLLDGLDDLVAQIGAYQRFVPGIRLQRRGDIRHCQGVVLADWTGVGTDGQERMSGTNVFVLGADGRIESATGFTTPPAASVRSSTSG